MKRMHILVLIAMIAALVLSMAACGTQETEQTVATATAAAQEQLGLADWSLTTTTWSSPNGATVHLTATPIAYTEGQSAAFVVRLEGDDVENVACEWDGTAYTASADLNAVDGYCYYVILTGSDGEELEVAVNTPSDMTDDALINIATALNSYCNVVVTASSYDGDLLTITEGSVEIQPPQITNDGEAITCTEALLVLTMDDETVAQVALTLPEQASNGSYTLQLTDAAFQTPDLEDDQQLSLRLDVTLSNGQTLTALGGTWFANDGDLLLAVG